MRWSGVLLVCVVLTAGCQQAAEVPVVPPLPEDLSTWTVPALVQPPPRETSRAQVEEKPTAAEKVYPFAPGTPYTIAVPVGWPLDIVLEPGEQIHNIVGGDRAPTEAMPSPRTAVEQSPPPAETAPVRRWEVKEGKDGTGDALRGHIFVAASAPGLTTGLIVTTTRRTYYLTCHSVKTSPLRVLRWQYPQDDAATPLTATEPGLLPDPQEPRHYHVGYELVAAKPPPSWQPRQVIDDGKKTYIIYPEVALFTTVPMLRLLGPNGPQLVNARQFLNVVIVDQLVARGELRVGIGEHAETVTITRRELHTIACPGDQSCPVWPQAAATLARRQP